MPPVEAYIAKWHRSSGSELGASQSFIMELCDLLAVPRPASPRSEVADNAYTFEAQINFTKADGTPSTGRIDLYKEGFFIWESKQGSPRISKSEREAIDGWRQGTAVRGTRSWDNAMIMARTQAEEYARGIPANKRPPFILVSDIGLAVDVYADFQNSGTYAPFPTARDNRIHLEDMRRPEIRERLRLIWTDPMALDPSREREKVTRDIAVKLASLAKSLESSGYDPKSVADNIMGFILIMFAEDCNLLPNGSFTRLMADLENKPEVFVSQVNELWLAMSRGGRSTAIEAPVARFAGPFDSLTALPLTKEQIIMLHEAATANWAAVEPSIFGTLLRRTIDPQERHKLGAHYTPPAYVEKLVYPTVIEPLRTEWNEVVKSALAHVGNADHESALRDISSFHRQLSETVVLDPSCGSGNFLATSLQMLSALEGEVIQALRDLGQTDLDITRSGYTVTPRQFRGIEISPHAAAISQLVLWISYLQNHFQLYGNMAPTEPILRDYGNIECRDAVLAWDRYEDVREDHRYLNARPADEWPTADYIVGNPPFIGNKRMRMALGDTYVDALRRSYPDVPNSAEFVMYWWYRAAVLVRENKIKQFGLITTNGIRQTFNSRVVDRFLDGTPPVSLIWAVPDHPWIDSDDGAQVRIAMTVGAKGDLPGELCSVILERPDDGFVRVDLDCLYGKINSKIALGADTKKAHSLKANSNLSFRGMTVSGKGFIITKEESELFGLGNKPGLEKHIRPYMNGSDVARNARGKYIIDFYGLSLEEVKRRYPEAYNHLVDSVKPHRDKAKRQSRKDKWWIFAEPAPQLRNAVANLSRYIVIPQTSRRFFFTFLESSILPDDKLVIIASDDAYVLGILSSRIHRIWAIATGGHLGAGNDPVYLKNVCFDNFPFPSPTEEQRVKISTIAENIDLHRKERQAEYPKLTL